MQDDPAYNQCVYLFILVVFSWANQRPGGNADMQMKQWVKCGGSCR